ncbi:TetR/AcrR family transcriptional regulator [Flindersiella endophytica]
MPSRREEIVDAALATIAERGYKGASLAEIAQRVGLTQQGLLHYFRSKELLLEAVLARRDELDHDHFFGTPHTAAGGLEALGRLVEHNTERHGLVQAFTVLSGESVTDGHPAREFFQRRYAELRRSMAAGFAAEYADRLPVGVTPEQAAVMLIAVLDGMQVQWLLDPDEIDMPALFRTFLGLLGHDPEAAPER